MDFGTFLIQILNSVQYGLLLFMLAAGLTLIFGIMGVVNLAHGSFYMLGAYLAWFLAAQLGSFTLALVVGVVLAVAFGLLLERVLFRYFYHRSHLDQVLLTFGLIYIFEESRSILWGDDVHSVGQQAAYVNRKRFAQDVAARNINVHRSGVADIFRHVCEYSPGRGGHYTAASGADKNTAARRMTRVKPLAGNGYFPAWYGIRRLDRCDLD